jgi:DNA-binding protein H-NS
LGPPERNRARNVNANQAQNKKDVGVDQFEYMILDLNTLPRRQTLDEALNKAGAAGWELVSISNTNLAIFKRFHADQRDADPRPQVAKAERPHSVEPPRQRVEEREKLRHEMEQIAKSQGLSLGEILDGGIPRNPRAMVVKYRDPANPDNTWSGRGRMPKWLSEAVAAGLSKEKFKVEGGE